MANLLAGGRVGVLHRFSGKRAAAAWLKTQGFTQAHDCAAGAGGGWRCGVQLARWVPLPDQSPAGLLIVSRDRGGV